jgi:hypothetical protein
MSAYLSPIGNEQQNDANGSPLSGGLVYTYAAGTLNAIATYTDSDGLTAQANPIVLNSGGLPDSPIWLPAGQAVKMVIQDASGVTQRTVDNVVGINDPAGISSGDQWVIYTGAPTFLSATSFSVGGDQRNTFQVGRRVRTANSGGTVYSTIVSVAFAAVTTVTVVNDSGVLDSGLSQASYGLLSATNTSLPRGPAFSAYQSTLQSVPNSNPTKIQLQTEESDTGGCFDNTVNYRFTPTVAGYYQVNCAFALASSSNALALLYRNGAEYKRGATGTINSTFSCMVQMNGSTDYIELFGFQVSGGPVNTAASSMQTYCQAFFVRPL